MRVLSGWTSLWIECVHWGAMSAILYTLENTETQELDNVASFWLRAAKNDELKTPGRFCFMHNEVSSIVVSRRWHIRSWVFCAGDNGRFPFRRRRSIIGIPLLFGDTIAIVHLPFNLEVALASNFLLSWSHEEHCSTADNYKVTKGNTDRFNSRPTAHLILVYDMGKSTP